MISICGYNSISDINCLDIYPQNIENISKVEIKNGVFNHYNLSSDISIDYNINIPVIWDFLTLMDANFNGNIEAGNVNFLLNTITAIKIKRRIKGDFNWLTLKTYSVNEVEDLYIIFNDYLNQNFVEYEYAYVPILNGVEGDYITNTVISNFNGIFICEQDEIYKLYADTSYGSMTQVREVGEFNVYGNKYPIIVSNGLINYKKGSVGAKIMPSDFINNGILNREDMVKNRDVLLDFFTNNQSKIIKDWNGNFWLVSITGEPSVDFDSSFGMGMSNIQFDWIEIGSPNNEADLISNGVIEQGVV